jgi:hypothetical protein
MKNKVIIVLSSFLAVLICLIVSVLLFYSVTPRFLLILTLTIGIVTGICIATLVVSLSHIIKMKRLKREQEIHS